MTKQRLQWHPGFFAVLQIEFEEELEKLTFENEHQLSEKPLAIDVLVIKKKKGASIQKNIGWIFREHNIIEYKEPRDYLSINDYYKVLAYTCLYQANTRKVCQILPGELTMTFVCNHYPRELIKHLQKQHGIGVKAGGNGIYYLTGGMFPTQFVINHQLSEKENFWLSRLRGSLDVKKDIQPLAECYKEKQKNPLYAAAMDLVMRANSKEIKEEADMCEAILELFGTNSKELFETGVEEGETKYSRLILKLLEEGREDLVKASASDEEIRRKLYQEYSI